MKDNFAVCSMQITKDEILEGSGEILKVDVELAEVNRDERGG
jgi:hypothetical protein